MVAGSGSLVWASMPGLGCMGASWWLPPLLSPSPQVGKHTGVLWVQLRDRVGSRVARNGGWERVTHAVGLGHVEVGNPCVSSAPGGAWTCPESIGDSTGAGVKNLLHHTMGWEQ